MSKVILISGKQGSGKTTTAIAVARELIKRQYFVETMKFADPLYVMHEYIQNYMERMTGKPRTIKDGTLLQLLGTEWGRKIHGESVWVDILKNRVAKTERDFVIIDDARFENEFDAFPDALSVRLIAPEHVRIARAEGWRNKTDHASETGLDRYEAEGKFKLTFDTSKESVDEIVKKILRAGIISTLGNIG